MALAVSPAIVIVVPLELVSIPAPPKIPKSALPEVSLAIFSSSVTIVTPVISPAVKAAFKVDTVVASKASILLKVAVPEESVSIFVPSIEIPELFLKSNPPSCILNI